MTNQSFQFSFSILSGTALAKPLMLALLTIVLGGSSGCSDQDEHEEDVQEVTIKTPEKNELPFSSKVALDPKTIYQLAQQDQVHPEFEKAVVGFHKDVLAYVAQTYSLPTSELEQFLENYEKHQQDIVHLHFESFKQQLGNLLDASSQYEVIQDQYYDASVTLSRVLEDYTCTVIELSIGIGTAKASKILTKQGYKYLIRNNPKLLMEEIPTGQVELSKLNKVLYKGAEKTLENSSDVLVAYLIEDPCQALMGPVMDDLSQNLLENGWMTSLNESKVHIEKYVRTAILELAIVEDEIDFSVTHDFRIEAGPFDLFSSNGSVTTDVTAIAKAGFKLDRGYQVELNHQTKKLTVIIPEAEILSTQIFTQYRSVEEGWLVEIEGEELNSIERKNRRVVERKVRQTDILSEAHQQARNIIPQMLGPLLLRSEYSVNVQFGKNSQDNILH